MNATKKLSLYSYYMQQPSKNPTPSARSSKASRHILLWLLTSVGALMIGTAVKKLNISLSWNSPNLIVCSANHKIYTVDKEFPHAECVSVKDGRFATVGSYETVIKHADNILHKKCVAFTAHISSWTLPCRWLKASPTVVHLNPEHIMVPGLADAHAHIIENGFMMNLPLKDTNSAQDVVQRLKEYILAHPELANDTTAWIQGMGWDHTKWADSAFPTAADFEGEPLLRDRLISLSRVDGHAKWVSRAVLEGMYIPEGIAGGVIVRDTSNTPTGIFIDKAMDLIPSPQWSQLEMDQYFNLTITEAISYGLTSIHDADTSPERIMFFQSLADAGKLPIRLYLMGYIESETYWGNQIPRLVNYGKHSRLNLRSVKLFIDGAFGSWSAALFDPYSDNQKETGLLRYDPDVLQDLASQFWKDGWQINMHCVGDRANHLALDVLENISRENQDQQINSEMWRPRIEHALMLNSSNLERMRKIGVIASVQPTQATTDMYYAESRLVRPNQLATWKSFVDNLQGFDRAGQSYAYRSLLNASPQNVLPLGSDFPVESVNPLYGFYAAITRLSPDGFSPHGSSGWFPQERITREQALKGMTYDAAYASFSENEIGSITPGKKADFVVFDRDIMTITEGGVLSTKVIATVLDGTVMYGQL